MDADLLARLKYLVWFGENMTCEEVLNDLSEVFGAEAMKEIGRSIGALPPKGEGE